MEKKSEELVRFEIENDMDLECNLYTNWYMYSHYPNIKYKVVISNLAGEVDDKDTITLLKDLDFTTEKSQGKYMVNTEPSDSAVIVDELYYIESIEHEAGKVTINLKETITADSYCDYWVTAYEELYDDYKENIRQKDWYLKYKSKWDKTVDKCYENFCKNEEYKQLSGEQKTAIKATYSYYRFDNFMSKDIEFDDERVWNYIEGEYFNPISDFYGEDEEKLEKVIENLVRNQLKTFIEYRLKSIVEDNLYISLQLELRS